MPKMPFLPLSIRQLADANVAAIKYRSWLTNKSFLDSFLDNSNNARLILQSAT